MTTRKRIKKRCKELGLSVEKLSYADFNGWEGWVKDKYDETFCLTGDDVEEIMRELEDFKTSV